MTHSLRSRDSKRDLKRALAITASFVIVEGLGGLLSNSLALLADAGHMLTDAAALGLSLFAIWISSRPATAEKTYGYYRVEILVALLNGVTLVLIALGIFYEAYQRFLNPPLVNVRLMLAIASIGLIANLVNISILRKSQAESLNIRGAFLHIIGDALSSVGAIIAGLLMLFKRWYLADPAIGIMVGVLILYSSWRLLKSSVDILLEGAPSHINLQAMRTALSSVEGVESVHDLHVWTLTSGMHAMSCHAVVRPGDNWHEILENMSRICRERFHIEHTTIQLEEESLRKQEIQTCH